MSLSRRRMLEAIGLTAAAQMLPCKGLASPVDRADGPDAFFNQIGYRPGNRKTATVRGAASGQARFRIRTAADGEVVFEGDLGAPRSDALSGDRVQTADFTALHAGRYRLEVGGQVAGPFMVGDSAHADALRVAMRAFTGQRCGCEVDLGRGYKHPACHKDGAYGASSGRVGSLPNHGGWHDAGDYGRYIVNSGISCGTLLWAWEMYPNTLGNLRFGVPRGSGTLPEYMEEVLWNLRWMTQLQDIDGGVWHKQTSDHFCAFIMPQDDALVSHVIGVGEKPYKSTAASADFAAVMAIAARCYRPLDQKLADEFLQRGRRACAWAMAHPAVVFRNPPGVSTGEYGDPRVTDELLWANAELWRTTGEAEYGEAFVAGLPAVVHLDAPSWGGVLPMACWTYLMASHQRDVGVERRLRAATREAAQQLIMQGQVNGYGQTLVAENYTWGSNGTAANQSLLLAVAHHLEPQGAAVDAAMGNLHYLLGRNCFGVSWVTQLGTRPFMHPHHRPSAADGIVDPWPGLLSGGPNRGGGDKVADRLPKLAPMRMWVDDQDAYSLNEVAINWNAPLVFLLAFANDRASRG